MATKNTLKKDSLVLPFSLVGKIDFDFMRRYIATLKAERVATLKAYLTAAGLSNTILTEGELAALDALRQNRVMKRPIPLKDIFRIEKGKRLTKADMLPGSLNYIGAISTNNGIRQKIHNGKIWEPNCITVNYNGSVGYSFYQEEPFHASDDVNVLYALSNKLNRNIALFLCSCLFKVSRNFNYSEKWTKERMLKSAISLPVDNENQIQWNLIELYISAQIKLSIEDLLKSKDLEIKATEDVIADSDYSQLESDESHKLMLAAEPFEIYNWKKVTDTDPKETVLIGCYRDKKHLEWIRSHLLYNIRLGKRKGTADFYHQCFANAKVLYLYDANQTHNYIVYKIESHQEMSGAELIDLDYPRKSPGKSYMTFRLVELQTKADRSLNITGILSKLDNHTKGTPIFIESDHEIL